MTKLNIKTAAKAATAAALAALISASAASAATLSLTYEGSVTHYDGQKGFQSVNVTSVVPTKNHFGLAGAFVMDDVNSTDSFIVYCLDLLATVSDSVYKVTDTPFANSTVLGLNGEERVQKLFDSGYESSLANSISSAGFQVALWNAIYDTDWDVTNAASGFYQSDTGAVQTAANAFLSGAENFNISNKWSLSFLEGQNTDPRTQNLVTAELSPVPLPASGLFLVSAMGGLVLHRRRKAA